MNYKLIADQIAQNIIDRGNSALGDYCFTSNFTLALMLEKFTKHVIDGEVEFGREYMEMLRDFSNEFSKRNTNGELNTIMAVVNREIVLVLVALAGR